MHIEANIRQVGIGGRKPGPEGQEAEINGIREIAIEAIAGRENQSGAKVRGKIIDILNAGIGRITTRNTYVLNSAASVKTEGKSATAVIGAILVNPDINGKIGIERDCASGGLRGFGADYHLRPALPHG